ncbi:MAG: hypothetical protein LBS99_03685 [Clostridiales bacterium]|jgi:hypothetical protein|nr:hypothetical protein [Clostridiales bacterium]
MKNYFLLYDNRNDDAAAYADAVWDALAAAGNTVNCLDAEGVDAALFAADYLLFFAFSDKELESFGLEKSWRYFINEMSLRRKKSGEVILVLDGSASANRTPYRLKDCRKLSTSLSASELIAAVDTSVSAAAVKPGESSEAAEAAVTTEPESTVNERAVSTAKSGAAKSASAPL